MSGSVGDNTARASGVIASAGGGGKVLQTLEYSKIGTVSWTGTSWANIGSIEQAITPAGESSKMKLTFFTGVSDSTNRGFLRFYYDVDGGGYNVCDPVGEAAGSRTTCHLFIDEDIDGRGITILHTPSYSLGNVLTYQMWAWTSSGGHPFYLGKDKTDGDSSSYARCQTILRVEEIAA